MSKLTDFLKEMHSKDIANDEKMFKRITSDTNRKKLQRLAMNISEYHNINLKMGLFAGSYASPNRQGILVNIDPTMFYYPDVTFEQLWVICQGATAHEAGHIAYSNFDIVGENKKREKLAQCSIPEIGKLITEDKFDGKTKEGKEILDTLYSAIYNYIYYKQLADMFNSIEDAGIEHTVPAYAPRTHGSLVALRNNLYDGERTFLNQRYLNYKKEDKDDFGYFITEIRHFAVIGYRKNITPIFLPDILSTDQIHEVELLGLYGRMGTSSSEERNAISEVLLDMLKPLIEKKAKEFMDKYLMNLTMSADEIAGMMDMEMNGHTEMVCQGALDPSLAGSTKPQNITSDYQIDLPQHTMDKVNEKMKERQKENDESESQGTDGKSQDKSNSSESSSQSQAGSKKSDNESAQQDSEVHGNDGNDSADSEESAKNSKENSSAENNDSADASNISTCEETNDLNTDEGETRSSASTKPLDKATAALEAESAYKDSLKKAEKSFEKENANEFKQSISEGGGTAPKLESCLGNPNSISDCHKGIKTKYYPSSKLDDMSSSGSYVKRNEASLKKISAQFSKKLKEVLMYRAKVRRKTGLKNGNIHDAALSRIITDQRIFIKKINGIEKKARIAVLIDLSGSMSGEKVRDAISAAYMLADACSKIKVPISIMGHNTGSYYINLYHYVSYDNCMKKDAKEKILCAEAGGANHDGLAIFHAATDLVRHRKPDEQLVLLVISDGAPAGINGYYGDVADKDIQKITNTFAKQYNVKTIGVGIGNDVMHVPNIYKNYLIVPNVEKLGDELLKVLKSLLL